MENVKVWKLVGGIVVLIGAVIALTPFNLFHVCTESMMTLKNGMPVLPRCHWTGIAEVFLGLLIAFNGLLILFAKGNWSNLTWMLMALSLAVIVVPTDLGIGVCASPEMPCHATQAALTTLGVTSIVVALVGRVVSKKLATSLQHNTALL
jgi:hypothetical protein